MYRISKQFMFSASHSLCGLKEGHPCARVHGHNYVVTIELTSDYLDETGMVLDYRELQPVKEFIDKGLDHQHLNDVMPKGMNPTAENIAKYIYDRCYKILYEQNLFDKMWMQGVVLSAVSVKETDKTEARYETKQ